MAENQNEIIAQKVLELVGGASNVVSATNCMTRLRLLVKDDKKVKTEEIKRIMGVLGLLTDGTLIQVVLGPGKVRKVADEFNELLKLTENELPSAVLDEEKRKEIETANKNLSDNKFIRFFQKIGLFFKRIKFKKGLRHIGNCFSPLIPGFIFFGICYSISVIINVCLGTTDKGLVDVLANMDKLPAGGVVAFFIFRCIAIGFMDYLAIFVGINAAKEFGVTPVLGGAIGGLSICPSIMNIAIKLGWFSERLTDGSYIGLIIKAGNGGVLAVILAVFLLGFLERFIRKHMPNVLDTVFTPLITMIIGGTVFLFVIMPIMGIITTGITNGIKAMSSPTLPIVARLFIGFALGACFLPIISLGLHHGLTPFYAELSDPKKSPYGLILYPIFAMNDACQVGVAASIWVKAKRSKHTRLQNNIAGGIVPQILGISEPLIYGMTLPMGRPYLPIALGAGIGGAWINAWGVGFCSFDCSGLMGIPLCMYVNGKINPGLAIGLYVSGWLIAVISGFILATFLVKNKHLERIPRD